MKRILVLLFIVLGILSFGDNSNFESFVNNAGYVEEVKKYDNSNGTMEKQAKEYLELLEFIYFNRSRMGELMREKLYSASDVEYQAYMERMKTGEFNKLFRSFGIFIPIVENVKWEVEKETEKGKLIRVSSPNARVHIQTSKKGSKFEISGKLKGYIKMNYNPNPAERNLKLKNKKTYFEEISQRDLNRNYLFRYYLEQTKYNIYKKVTEAK
jgi:hypothetical protein